MQLKKRVLDGNLERKVAKVIRIKLSLDQNLLDMLKVTTQFKQYFFYKEGSNLPKRTIWAKLYCLVIKIYKKTFQGERKKLFIEPYCESLRAQDGWNSIVSWYEFTEYFVKYNTNQTISAFDKDWLNFPKRTIWVNLYCQWLVFASDILK